MRSWTLKLFSLVAILLASACVYRQDIPQGNFFKAEDVEKLQEGMTREQVRYVMGTPMITDPFHPQRWDYVFYVDSLEDERDYYRRVTVFFEGDTATRIETQGVEEGGEAPRGDEGIRLEDEAPLPEKEEPHDLEDPIPGQ